MRPAIDKLGLLLSTHPLRKCSIKHILFATLSPNSSPQTVTAKFIFASLSHILYLHILFASLSPNSSSSQVSVQIHQYIFRSLSYLAISHGEDDDGEDDEEATSRKTIAALNVTTRSKAGGNGPKFPDLLPAKINEASRTIFADEEDKDELESSETQGGINPNTAAKVSILPRSGRKGTKLIELQAAKDLATGEIAIAVEDGNDEHE